MLGPHVHKFVLRTYSTETTSLQAHLIPRAVGACITLVEATLLQDSVLLHVFLDTVTMITLYDRTLSPP